MASGRFSKQAAPFLAVKLNNVNDATLGGAISSAPSGLSATQGWQDLPGDRIILSPADALAYANNTTGKLYTGTYRYVNTANSTAAPTLGHGSFWVDVTGANNGTTDGNYQVTADEPANFGVSQFAGVFLNSITKLNYGWIQESGKATCFFRNALSGGNASAGNIGAGVYLAAGGNNNNAIDVGSFDQFVGGNSAAIFTANSTTAYNTLDNFMVRYVGVALVAPANNAASLVDLVLNRASFRW